MALFVAVDVPAGVRRRVSAALPAVQTAAPHLRFAAAASWHVTLAFLGRVEPGARPALVGALAGVCVGRPAFDVGLDGRAATFGGRVLWAAFEPCPALRSLATAVRSATRAGLAGAGGTQCGQPPAQQPHDEAFTAHLTLARTPRGGARVPPAAIAAYDGPKAAWRVTAVQLLSSTGRSAGAAYTVEGEWPLGGSAPSDGAAQPAP